MDDESVNPLHGVTSDERLAGKLADVTEQALDKLSELLRHPVDVENGSLLRAQATASAVAINAQLRADAMRLRAIREDRAMATLIALIASKEKGVPCDAVPALGSGQGHVGELQPQGAAAVGSMAV